MSDKVFYFITQSTLLFTIIICGYTFMVKGHSDIKKGNLLLLSIHELVFLQGIFYMHHPTNRRVQTIDI